MASKQAKAWGRQRLRRGGKKCRAVSSRLDLLVHCAPGVPTYSKCVAADMVVQKAAMVGERGAVRGKDDEQSRT